MGDTRRFSKFADMISYHQPLRELRIVDVAGGKGYLQMALRQRGYSNILSIDKRPKMARNRKCYRYGWFSFNHKPGFDLVVAMHPDQGTDHSILYAVKNRVPFLVCPCCILPSATAFWDRKKFPAWLEHLKQLAVETHEVVEEKLKIEGRNQVLIGTPR